MEFDESHEVNLLLEEMAKYELPSTAGMSAFDQLSSAMNMFEAARKALGLINKLSAGPTKKAHASRVLGALNKIRAHLRRIEKQISIELLS